MKIEESYPNRKKTVREKEKLLVTSNFSFSHSVFKRLVLQTRKNHGLFGKGMSILCGKVKTQSPSILLVKPRKDMNNVTGLCGMTHILLKAALNTILLYLKHYTRRWWDRLFFCYTENWGKTKIGLCRLTWVNTVSKAPVSRSMDHYYPGQHVFPGFCISGLTQFFIQSHLLLFLTCFVGPAWLRGKVFDL